MVIYCVCRALNDPLSLVLRDVKTVFAAAGSARRVTEYYLSAARDESGGRPTTGGSQNRMTFETPKIPAHIANASMPWSSSDLISAGWVFSSHQRPLVEGC